MLRIAPFCAVRPAPGLAPRVASLPYDVVSTEEARELAADNPDSFLHVVRSEIDLPPSTAPDDPAVYDRARENFQRLLDGGIMIRDQAPGLFIYRQALGHRLQAGLVCCCHVDDYNRDVIRKHERTRPDKEDDRTRHILALRAQPGPVFLTFRDDRRIERLMADDMNDRPVVHFDAPDGVTHTVWAVHDPGVYVEAFAGLPAAYVADGHHRTASAARAAAELAAANPGHTGREAYNWFLSVLFPAGQLRILPYNRLVRDLHGLGADDVLAALGRAGRLQPATDPQPAAPGRFGIYLDGAWHELVLPPESIDRADPIASLDVDLLQKRVLEPILGIGDPRTDARLEFVGGVRGPGALQQRVDAGKAAMGICMFPTSIDQLLAVADAGLIMPPKSTWFEPKLRSGLFVHALD